MSEITSDNLDIKLKLLVDKYIYGMNLMINLIHKKWDYDYFLGNKDSRKIIMNIKLLYHPFNQFYLKNVAGNIDYINMTINEKFYLFNDIYRNYIVVNLNLAPFIMEGPKFILDSVNEAFKYLGNITDEFKAFHDYFSNLVHTRN